MSETLALLARRFPNAGKAPAARPVLAPEEAEDSRAQERSRRKHERLMAQIPEEERAPVTRCAPTGDALVASRDRVDRDRREQFDQRCERLSVPPPDWSDLGSVSQARAQADAADAERLSRAVQRDESGRVVVVGSWLYERFMTLDEVAREFETREGRPMGSPISLEEKAKINEQPRLFRVRRKKGGEG